MRPRAAARDGGEGPQPHSPETLLPFTPRAPPLHSSAAAQIATEHLCGSCKQCGGSLTNTVRPDVARKRLVVFRNLAAYHNFELLQQLADGALALA